MLSKYNYLTKLDIKIPDGWTVNEGVIWTGIKKIGHSIKPQGWKIHISCEYHRINELFISLIPYLIDKNVEFKVISSDKVAVSVNNKLWPRESSGKLVTIYPSTDNNFVNLGNDLTELLKNYTGPYILSDKRWPNSRCIFYRYGGFILQTKVRTDGVNKPVIMDDRSNYIIDKRVPYWVEPTTLSPVIQLCSAEKNNIDVTNSFNRYQIKSSLAFSSRGGVYKAIEKVSNKELILKEARPHILTGFQGIDSIEILTKEFDILKELESSDLFVKPIELFKAWENWFLVEELITGNRLGHFIVINNPLYLREYNQDKLSYYFQLMKPIWSQILDAILYSHEKNIIIGDLSFTNIIVQENNKIKILDLEASVRVGTDRNVGLYTQGISSRRAMDSGFNDYANDFNCLGSIILGSIAVMNSMLGFDESLKSKLIQSFHKDVGVSKELLEFANELIKITNYDIDTKAIYKKMKGLNVKPENQSRMSIPVTSRITEPNDIIHNVTNSINSISNYLISASDFSSKERLFPADSMVYQTNPLSIAYGALGIMYAIKKSTSFILNEHLEWVKDILKLGYDYSASMYFGSTGMAWCLLELEEEVYATNLLNYAEHKAYTSIDCSISCGLSGFGLGCLKFWHHGHGIEYLNKAIKAGNALISLSIPTKQGTYWKNENNEIKIGYANGASGISCFLLYLYLATDNSEYLSIGMSGLKFDLAQGGYSGGFFSGFPDSYDLTNKKPTLSCYWHSGTAGVLTTLIRYYKITNDESLLNKINECIQDLNYKYAAFPNLYMGLSGIGNVELDLYQILGKEDMYLNSLEKALSIMLCEVKGENGSFFSGDTGRLISCDYFTGGAGILMYFDRLVNEKPNFNFMLDELFM